MLSDIALEAHGTGTALGDPIEVGAAIRALGSSQHAPLVRCTAIRSNFGHLEAAASAVWFTSVLLLPLTYMLNAHPRSLLRINSHL